MFLFFPLPLFVLSHFFPKPLFVASDTHFTSRYREKTVTGLGGSSVNFTWSFSGDVGSIEWGFKQADSKDLDPLLVTVLRLGSVLLSPSAKYRDRVNGRGSTSSGLAIFNLRSIRKEDDGFYRCRINPRTDCWTVHNLTRCN